MEAPSEGEAHGMGRGAVFRARQQLIARGLYEGDVFRD